MIPNQLQLNLVNPASLKQGITQSELSCKDSCSLKWNLEYNNLVEKPGEWSWTLEFGTGIHEYLDKRYSGEEADPAVARWAEPGEDVMRDGEWEKNLTYWTAVMVSLQQAYERHYRSEIETMDIIAAESTVEREFMGLLLKGKIDLRAVDLAKDKHFMADHKTTSRPELMAPEGWDMRFQFMFYSWLTEPLMPKETFDFMMNILRKPALRQTKSETWDAFCRRIKSDILKRPDFYFMRLAVPISKTKIKHFEKTVLVPKLELYKRAIENEGDVSIRNPNTNNCFMYNAPCRFLPYCRNGDVELFQYQQRKTKHVELA